MGDGAGFPLAHARHLQKGRTILSLLLPTMWRI
jgi:hypothetical protein